MIAAAPPRRPGRTRTGLALLLAACMLAACSKRAAQLPALGPDDVVLAFGDSITFGTGAGEGQSYPAVLEGLIGRKVVRSGVPGEVSAAGLARLPSVLEEHRPQLLILCHGGNDLLRNLGRKQAAENIRSMIRLATDMGLGVLLVAVPEPGLFPSPPDFYKEIASEFGLAYEGEALKEILGDKSLKADLVHPNAQGYARLAEALAGILKRSGAIRAGPLRSLLLHGQAAVALAEGALHQHAVDPASELEPRGGQQAGESEPATLVQLDRSLVATVADDRDHLPAPGALAGRDEHREQRGPDAMADMIAVHVDGVLDREPVGGPRPVGRGIGESHHRAAARGH